MAGLGGVAGALGVRVRRRVEGRTPGVVVVVVVVVVGGASGGRRVAQRGAEVGGVGMGVGVEGVLPRTQAGGARGGALLAVT